MINQVAENKKIDFFELKQRYFNKYKWKYIMQNSDKIISN